MKITKTWKDIRPNPPDNELESAAIELSANELDLVLAGLKQLHRQYANLHEANDIENCRLVSDLYYGLKY